MTRHRGSGEQDDYWRPTAESDLQLLGHDLQADLNAADAATQSLRYVSKLDSTTAQLDAW